MSRARRFAVLAMVLGATFALVLAVSACGGSSSSSSGSTGGEGSGGSTGGESSEEGSAKVDPALGETAGVKAVIERALEGPVYTSVENLEEATPEDFKPATSWTGPTSAPEVESGKSIQIVVCLFGTACQTGGEAAKEAVEKMGWSAELIDGKGTAEGAEQGMSTALSKQPDGIITVSLPEGQIGDKLAEAKADGIPVVTIADANEEQEGYSAYVTRQELETSMLEAWYAIAESNGKAHVVFLWDTGYQHLVEGLHLATRIFESCKECKILHTYSRTLTTATNPTAMEQLTSSILKRYGSEVEYILTPYGFGVPPVLSAARTAGSDVKVLSKNAQNENLELVAAGEQTADFGSSIEWWGWAAADQLRRLIAGEEALPDAKEGLSLRAFNKETAPSDGEVEWLKPVDFKAEYEKIWGVK
jgi:ribose transport system substrate-binding protein